MCVYGVTGEYEVENRSRVQEPCGARYLPFGRTSAKSNWEGDSPVFSEYVGEMGNIYRPKNGAVPDFAVRLYLLADCVLPG